MRSAEADYRLGNFGSAFRTCREHVKSAAFQQLNDKKKHEAVKAFILYAHHSHRCEPKWSI